MLHSSGALVCLILLKIKQIKMKKYIFFLGAVLAMLSQDLCAEERYPETIIHGHVLMKGVATMCHSYWSHSGEQP